MNLVAGAANLAWATASLPATVRFHRALADPRRTQLALLRCLLEKHATTAFGRAHGFTAIRDYAEYVARVPLAGYDDFEPWIARIRQGEARVLASETVTRLVPTSGSTGARKLIPFTAGLQRQFNAAIGPWMSDLFRTHPALLGGTAYWSISPAVAEIAAIDSAVPIGFDDDASYLGGARRRLVAAIMAVPSSLRHAPDAVTFRRETLLALLRREDLRLISVWHPSFLALLLDELASSWRELVHASGSRRLSRASPEDLRTIWPELRVVSCWSDGHAALAAKELAQRLPGVVVQSKGLLATEACVTLPCCGAHPLAITSHVFEFLADDGSVHLADELNVGAAYEVVVTTAGGLWRYRLGDRVVVDGVVGRTPSLRFLGRVGGVSDRRGEKLSEAFVAGVLRDLFAHGRPPRFVLLAPEENDAGCGYVLFVEGRVEPSLAADLDTALRTNPAYAWCRDLGQLGAPRLRMIASGGYEAYVARVGARGQRWGDIKPSALSAATGWSQHFRLAETTREFESSDRRP